MHTVLLNISHLLLLNWLIERVGSRPLASLSLENGGRREHKKQPIATMNRLVQEKKGKKEKKKDGKLKSRLLTEGPNFFFFFNFKTYTLSKAHQLNISFAFKLLNPFPTFFLFVLGPPDPTTPYTPSSTLENKMKGLSEHLQSSQTKPWQACKKRLWSERSWQPPTMKIHRGGNSAGSWLKTWTSSNDSFFVFFFSGGEGRVQRKWDKLPIFHFGTLLLVNTTISIWFVFVWELQICSWTIKTETDPFI